MNLKCLINLLLEKKYITEVSTLKKGRWGIIAKEYICEYEEVREKIIDTIENNHFKNGFNNIDYNQKTYANKQERIVIMNTKKLKEYILSMAKLYDHDEFSVDTNDFNMLIDNLDYIFMDDQDLDFNKTKVSFGHYRVVNLKRIREREEKEAIKKKECLDFLSKLP